MRIQISIEDKPDNKVELVIHPSAETLLKKIASEGAHRLTPAETYALAIVNHVRALSQEASSRIIVTVPRIGRK